MSYQILKKLTPIIHKNQEKNKEEKTVFNSFYEALVPMTKSL